MLLRGTALWRPIVAVIEPQIQCFYLRTAARAFTVFLRLLTREICASFLVLKITELQPWIHGLSDWECEVIENAFPAVPAARSLGNQPNLWSFLDSTLLCPRGLGARFYHIVWPFYAAILISPYHGDLEKARVMLRGANPGAGVR